MTKEYALIDKLDNILYKSDGFDMKNVKTRVSLSNDTTLLITEDDDITSLKRQLEEALDANESKEAFLSNMSHDIRTPMNAIIGMTALAKKYIDEKPKVIDSLNKIEVASAHLLSLITEVLDMSRINSGKLIMSEDIFYISDLLHDVLTIVTPQIEQKHHHFSFEVNNINVESLRGDTLRLRQIMVNIINNAIKYTEDNGNIKVSVKEEIKDDICVLHFVCEDDGIGMSEEFLSRIFVPFERVNTTTISKIEGTGLGMSIVKKLIDNMGGEIKIDSKINEGTKVYISIPMRYEVIKVNTSSLEGKHLLVIESSEDLKNKYHEYFKELDIRYEIVNKPDEAISALTDSQFNETRYDGVIIGNIFEDINNIFPISSYIHKAERDIPIILVSSHKWEDIEYSALRNGITDFIPVPFFRKSLINGLDEALKIKDEEKEEATNDFSGKRILLVEDNMINREIAKEILSSTRAEIDIAENGLEAFNKYYEAEENYYNVILMDIQMPVMNGYEACEKIRSCDKKDATSIPIFAMTANTFMEDINKAKQAGMNGHIAKPIDINKLMSTLRQVF